MSDLNSSDLEFSSPEDNSARSGRRAKASMIEHSARDRIESKKAVKTLQHVGNAPGTTISRLYWYGLFEQFAAVTLRIGSRTNKTPTGDDLARFLSRLPGHLQSRHSDGKIAWTVVREARISIDNSLAFHYADHKLSRHDNLRIDAIIQKLLNDGEITKDPVREKQWLSCQIVKKLATAVLSDAIQNGTKSWDMTLAGSFSLVLQAALCSRSGDFTRSAHYGGEEYLKWQDVQIVATVHDGEVTLKMLVELRYCKFHKRDGKVLSVELSQLDDDNSVVDPVKLCLAYALRIGLVQETSWSDLLDTVLRRPSKRVVWTRPNAPVFYGLTRSQHLDFDRPASVDQQRRFLCHAARLVGMLKMPVSHDLRRGAAADIYELKPDTGNTDRVRRALGHSMSAMMNGTTDDYIGRTKGDAWAARLNMEAATDPFGVQMATMSFQKRKVATIDIDKYCDTNDLDKMDRNDRYLARNKLSEAQHSQWATVQQTVADTAQPPTLDTSNKSLVGDTARAPFKDITNRPLIANNARVLRDTNKLLNDTPVPLHDMSNESNQDDAKDLVVGNINPLLRGFADDMLGVSADASDYDEDTGVESMAAGCIALWASSQACNESDVLTAAPERFVGYLSTVNLVSVATDTLPASLATGNSRDPPTRFLYNCNKGNCRRSFNSTFRRDQHQVNCSVEPSLENDADSEDTTTPSVPPMTASKRKRKRQDIDKVDEGFPKPCPDKEICLVLKDFATEHLLKNHRILHHDKTWPEATPCNFPGCQLPRDHYFISREFFRRHLHTYHLLDAAQAREYIGKIIPVPFRAPRGTSKNFLMTMCLFPGCKTETEFVNYIDYTGHLKKSHSRTVDQYPAYMPTAGTVRLHPRPDHVDIVSLVPRQFIPGEPCSHEDCSTSTAVYATMIALDRHLKRSHDLAADDVCKYYPGIEIAPFYNTRCLHPGCANRSRFFMMKQKYKEHLANVHKLFTVAETNPYQLWWQHKYP